MQGWWGDAVDPDRSDFGSYEGQCPGGKKFNVTKEDKWVGAGARSRVGTWRKLTLLTIAKTLRRK